jgi:hypothetical protein
VAGKKRVGMRCARESNPALVAQRDAERGTPMQVPRNRVSPNFQCSAAGVLADSILADLEVEWICFLGLRSRPSRGNP